MPTKAASIDAAATTLLDAEELRADRAPLTDHWPRLDIATAYAIQHETLRRRLARGERLVGLKLGLTSATKQQQMGVSSPLTAWLTDAMQMSRGGTLPYDKLIHPRVEPEVVFVMGEELRGPVTREQALKAVDHVVCGLEIIDSRYTDFRFTLPDVIADNASSALFVLGTQHVDPGDLDLAMERCRLTVDGQEVAVGRGGDVQGHPAEALARAVNDLAERGLSVEAGWTVLTGGITDAVTMRPGSTVAVEFDRLGAIELR
ncbi:MAG: 2-keto-4-pentenoate hydratase [Acidimicrobiia bacterium]